MAAGLALNFDIDGAEAMTRTLGIAIDRVKDLSPALEVVADNFSAHVERKFQNGGVDPKYPGDGKWAGYQSEPAYAAMKHSILGGGATAVGRWNKRGARAPWGPRERLGPSFAKKGHREHVREVGKLSLRVGSKAPHAGRFHRGGFQPFDRKQHPARPITTKNRKFMNAQVKVIQRHVDEAFATTETRGFTRPHEARLTGLSGRRTRL